MSQPRSNAHQNKPSCRLSCIRSFRTTKLGQPARISCGWMSTIVRAHPWSGPALLPHPRSHHAEPSRMLAGLSPSRNKTFVDIGCNKVAVCVGLPSMQHAPIHLCEHWAPTCACLVLCRAIQVQSSSCVGRPVSLLRPPLRARLGLLAFIPWCCHTHVPSKKEQ